MSSNGQILARNQVDIAFHSSQSKNAAEPRRCPFFAPNSRRWMRRIYDGVDAPPTTSMCQN
jgi:hypothetical protein